MAQNLKGEEKYYDNEHRVLTKTGEWLWVRSRGEVVERDEKGFAVRHTGTFHIIDDRKKSELALQRSENRFHDLLDHASDAIIMTDSGGRVILFNHSAEELFGYCSNEVLGKNVNIFLNGESRKEHSKYLKNYLIVKESTIIGKGREVVARHKTGTELELHIATTENYFAGQSCLWP